MKRLALTTLLVIAVAAAAFASAGAGGEQADKPSYWVEMDNAFGLIEGADVKVAGVRAGAIEDFKVDPKTYRALVKISINEKGFGDLRTDVFCESRPQSLIGEYFVDCMPGIAGEKLPQGATIPVEQTASTVSADLVNNIMRRPFRERFSIILGELGAALTARGEDLNETIRRASPALREVNKVLAQLREQRTVIRDLTDDAEDVVVALADDKKEVSRFIDEARDTSLASSERAEDIEKQFQAFPTFLRELRTTMKLLGEAADAQRPALANLSEQAPLLRKFLDTLGPFSEASRPAFRTLADLGRSGRSAIKVTTPRVTELAAFAKGLPELVTNLALTLEHLDDRRFAIEKDPRSPGGNGYTGLEAFLQYVFRQSQATNIYDANSYLLKVSAFLDNNCAQYATPEQARQEARQYCRAILGPNQLGIDQPDPTAKPARKSRSRKRKGGDGGSGAQDQQPAAAPQQPEQRPVLPDLLEGGLGQLLGGSLPGKPNPQVDPKLPLLDFLLGG